MADAPAPAATAAPSPTTAPDAAALAPTATVTGTPNPATPAAKAEVKRIKSLKLQVDGNEVEEALPFEMDDTPENREYMTKHMQMSKMGSKRAQEAAGLRKQVEDIGNYLAQAKGNKTQLRKLIKELGGDEKEIAAMIIEEEIANSLKSPDQLAREKLEQELKDMKESREREKAEFNAKELERRQGEETERLDVLVSQALETSGVPKKAASVRRMTDYMLLALENNIELTPAEVANIVKQEIEGDLQELIGAMGEDKAESFIGKDILSKIRKKNIAKAKASGATPASKKSGTDIGAKSSTTASTPAAKKTIKAMWGV